MSKPVGDKIQGECKKKSNLINIGHNTNKKQIYQTPQQKELTELEHRLKHLKNLYDKLRDDKQKLEIELKEYADENSQYYYQIQRLKQELENIK